MARRVVRRGRLSIREALLASKRSLDFMADAAGKPRMEFDIPPEPKRRKPSGENGEVMEKDVLRAVSELLERHPKILFAVRQNSGSLDYETWDKKKKINIFVPVWFYKLLRIPEEMTITDFWGFLIDGRPFAIECKKEKWRWKGTEREQRQAAFLAMIRKIGGVSGFVTDANQALAIIESGSGLAAMVQSVDDVAEKLAGA